MFKRVLVVISIVLFATFITPMVNGSANGDNVIINNKPTDPKPVEAYESEWISINRLGPREGIIMNDQPKRPSSFWEALSMSGGDVPGHTGWSVHGYVCERYISHYEEARDDNGEIVYDEDGNVIWKERWLSEWVDDVSKGGFYYATSNSFDSGSLVDYVGQLNSKYSHLGVDWTGARGELWAVAHWNILEVNTKTNDGNCQKGDVAYYYSDNDILMEGRVQVHMPDPSDDYEAPNRTNGSVDGRAFWELRRFDENKPSGVYVESEFEITGEHYAIRNIQHQIEVGEKTASAQKEGKLSESIDDASLVKGKNYSYSFSYEYTNHYRDIYECTDSENGHCYSWRFVERVPAWEYVKTFSVNDTLPIDHKQEETITVNAIEDVLTQKFTVGREDTYQPHKERKSYFEEWRKSPSNQVKSHYQLATQTTLPITPGALQHEIELPSGEHEKPNFQPLKKEMSGGFYFPADIDDSLKEEYGNETKYTGYPFAFPLQQSVMQDKGTTGGKRTFEWEYITDMFFMTDATGFIVGTPYAERVKDSLVKNVHIPSYEALMQEGRDKIAEEFTKTTRQTFVDHVLYTNANGQDFHKLQLYAIPVSADSPLRPNETYKNHLVLENMGLSDLTFRFDQSFLFKHYLFGSAKDDAWIVAQRVGRVSMANVTRDQVHKTVIKKELRKPIAKLITERTIDRMHKFRRADRDFGEKLREIIGEEEFRSLERIKRAELR